MATEQRQALLPAVQFLRRFPSDKELRRKQFEFEDALKTLFPKPPAVHNTPPNAPPQAPLFTFTNGRTALWVARNQITLNLDFGGGLPQSLIDTLQKYGQVLDDVYARVLNHQTSYFSAVVLYFTWPMPGGDHHGAIEESKEIAALLKQPPSNVASCNIIFGISEDNMFINMDVSSYAAVKRLLSPGEMAEIDPDFVVADEHGLQLKLELNTKPRLDSPKPGDFAMLVARLPRALTEDVERYLGARFAPNLDGKKP